MSGKGSSKGSSPKRQYRMRARARSTEATREAILDAVEVAFEELFYDEITLDAIAERSGVSVQTILRHFESKDRLFVTSILHVGNKMGADRGLVPVGNVRKIVDDLIDHYEKYGNRLLRILAQENREPNLKQIADIGRVFHAQWCEEAFAAGLKGLRGAKRERRLAQFVTCTDLYTWKLLRRDRELSLKETKLAMRELIEPLMKD
ncbi:MAG TPA: TetR/AcrR family transcriptional regulator [Solirubrobacterales bacterium]|nr:TetR/AcrR family transcriptional regulator [Solirubrobacterales bacterium]